MLFPTQVVAESQDFTLSQDTYANLAYPDKVNASQQVIIISNKNTTRLGYIQFEDINLPEGAIVDRGILKLYFKDVGYADVARFTIGPISANWDETTITWNNKPDVNTSQTQNNEVSITEIGWKEITITNLVNQWRDGTIDNFGLFMYPIDYLQAVAEPPFAITFMSRDSADNNAKLQIDYHFEPTPTPEPTATATPTPEPTLTLTPTESSINPTSRPTSQPTNTEPEDLNDESLELTKESTSSTDENIDETSNSRDTMIGVVIGASVVLVVGTGIFIYQKKKNNMKKEKSDEKKE